MQTLTQKADELLSLLEQFSNLKITGLCDFGLKMTEDMNNEHCPYRCGLSSRYNSFEEGYPHFYLFLDSILIYFSRNNIHVRCEKRYSEYEYLYQGSIDGLLDEHFQLSTQYELVSKDLFIRIKKFMDAYPWVKLE